MSTTSDQGQENKLTRFWPALLIAALVAWHAAYNWLWLSQNIVLSGWDKARHLAQSLAYNNLLTPLTLRTLFNALISDTVRPPLAPLAAVPLYRLFGVSDDVGVLVNLLYLTLTLVATWKIGVLLGGRKLGALSVVILALLPMFYAVSRYFYLEYPLMALVALTVWLLLASDGFQKRGTTVAWGILLGMGLLTKRTYVAFVFAPILLVVLRSPVLPALWQRIRGGLRVDLKDAALALAGGLILAGLWIFPNWETVRQLTLGGWLYPVWAGLVALTVYLLRRSRGPDVNFLAAAALGVSLGSLWYLANPAFVRRMLLFAYGVNDPRGRTIKMGSLATYTDYLRILVNQHLSLTISIILVTAALILAFALVRNRRVFSSLVRARTGWWALVLWILGPYLVLTLSIYHEARAITPVLPAIALLGAGILTKLPWKKVALVLIVLLIIFGLVQFYAVSFEPLHGLVEATSLQLPLLGQTSLFGWGGYLQLPDSAATDHHYWIEPDVLQRMEEQRAQEGWDHASLGLLVNTKQINFEHFAYLVQAGEYHPRLTVERLARAHGPEPVYPRLFRNDYLLVKRDNAAADADSQEVIDQILDQPTALFGQAFELDKSYELPDGDTAFLFKRRQRPPDGVAADYFPELAQTLDSLSQETDAIVVIPPDLLPLLGQYSEAGLDAIALPDSGSVGVAVESTAAENDRIFAIFGEWGAGDLDEAGRRWLNENGFRAWDAWFGPTQLVLYGTSEEANSAAIQPVGAGLGTSIRLLDYALYEDYDGPGGMLYVTLRWQPQKEMETGYKVFVHLVDSAGQMAAQRDGEPAGGSRPTTTWTVGETIIDRVGLLLPPGLASGEYELWVGMYDPETLERLPILDENDQPTGDRLRLGSLTIPADLP